MKPGARWGWKPSPPTRLYLALSLVWAVICLNGCLAGERQGARTSREDVSAPAAVALLDQPPLDGVTFPARAVDRRLGVEVDVRSARRAGVLRSGLSVWVLRGERRAIRSLADVDGRVVCVYVLTLRGGALAARCAGGLEVATPGAVMIVLSGGRDGAPRFRPREVMVAGIAESSTRRAFFQADVGREPMGLNGGVFFGMTQSPVRAVSFVDGAGGWLVKPVDTCQAC